MAAVVTSGDRLSESEFLRSNRTQHPQGCAAASHLNVPGKEVQHTACLHPMSSGPDSSRLLGSTSVHKVLSDAATYNKPGKQSIANFDGWQWRKYGEKMVKGSPNPRSYYKCSRAGCGAKKIVERSEDGEVTGTEYKGEHCHPAPGSAQAIQTSRGKVQSKAEQTQEKSMQSHETTVQEQSVTAAPTSDVSPSVSGTCRAPTPPRDSESTAKRSKARSTRGENAEEEEEPDEEEEEECNDSDVPLQTASQDARAALRAVTAIRRLRGTRASHRTARVDSNGQSVCAEVSSRPPQLRSNLGNKTEVETADSRERTSAVDCSVSHVIIESTDLNDGYKWRKYGQKQVKGNPNPRSYYKCTHQGCSVRKHVERSATTSSKMYITYEGQHNHPLPAGDKTAAKRQRFNDCQKEATTDSAGSQDVTMDLVVDSTSSPATPQAHASETQEMASSPSSEAMVEADAEPQVPTLKTPANSVERKFNSSALQNINLETFTQFLIQQAQLELMRSQSGSGTSPDAPPSTTSGWEHLTCLSSPRLTSPRFSLPLTLSLTDKDDEELCGRVSAFVFSPRDLDSLTSLRAHCQDLAGDESPFSHNSLLMAAGDRFLPGLTPGMSQSAGPQGSPPAAAPSPPAAGGNHRHGTQAIHGNQHQGQKADNVCTQGSKHDDHFNWLDSLVTPRTRSIVAFIDGSLSHEELSAVYFPPSQPALPQMQAARS